MLIMNDSLGQSGDRSWTLDTGADTLRGRDLARIPRPVLLQEIFSMLSEKTKSLSLATIYPCVKSAKISH